MPLGSRGADRGEVRSPLFRVVLRPCLIGVCVVLLVRVAGDTAEVRRVVVQRIVVDVVHVVTVGDRPVLGLPYLLVQPTNALGFVPRSRREVDAIGTAL